MDSTGINIFGTPIGPCGIAWDAGKIIGVEIGDADEGETRYRLQSRFATAETSSAPDYVSEAINKVQLLLDGGDPDFSQTPLALDQVPDLNRKVYEILLELIEHHGLAHQLAFWNKAVALHKGDDALASAHF